MIIGFTLLFLLLDIVSKYLVSEFMIFNQSIVLIDNLFKLTYVKNTGAAWSIFASNTFFIIFVSLLIIIALVYYIYKSNSLKFFEKLSYSLILGGALGNFFNRIFCGYVIDFIDLNIFDWNYPIFNLADTFIVLGVILLLIETWRAKK